MEEMRADDGPTWAKSPDANKKNSTLKEDRLQKEPPTAIKPIEAKDVHRICSGQVITTLASAIKELVENSVDAHSTNVDIHLIEYGSLEIQVHDNGEGVSNFEALTKKHCTSKINQFEDLNSIGTFGFRGEALSSLCALAELSVITRARDSEKAYRIEYDSNGGIVTKVQCARAVGTTIVLRNLFQPLPVRHREFIKNLKKEYNRMVNLLYGYCLILKGVRINLTNEERKGDGPKQVLCVPPLDSVKERLVCVFGNKQISSLLEVSEATLPREIPSQILKEYNLTESQFASRPFKLEGFVSKPQNGRSACDRQFLFINSRPFDSAKITKIINEVYHGYSSRNNYPLVVLNIITSQGNVDVNVSPDKRSIYLQDEKLLYSTIKAILVTLLSSSMSSNFEKNSSFEDGQDLVFPTGSESQSSRKKIQHSAQIQGGSAFAPQYSGVPSVQAPSMRVRSLFTRFRVGNSESPMSSQGHNQSESRSMPFQLANSHGLARFRNKQPKLSDFLSQRSSKIRKLDSEAALTVDVGSDSGSDEDGVEVIVTDSIEDTSQSQQSRNSQDSALTTCEYFYCDENEANESQLDLDAELECNISTSKVVLDEEMSGEGSTPLSPPLSPLICSQSSRISTENGANEFDDSEEMKVLIVYDDELESKALNNSAEFNGASINLKLDLEQLRNRLSQKLKSEESNTKCRARKFRAQLTDNSAAEQELRRELSRDMFKQMAILGQFNLGFIIARQGPDLFIIDQHASDEKYNYESLEKSLVLQSQKLICPKVLELPAVSENVLIDNLEVFRKNGFDFEIDLEEKPTTRIKLTQIPFSKSYEFGREDIEELIFMLQDATGTFCRPTKVRTMLASRACRKSVMIGMALGAKEMIGIVQHMASLDQPWNCPHGRPTLRHLFNLELMTGVGSLHFN